MLEAQRGTGKRFVYTSGSLVYGSTGDKSATEDTPLEPVEMVRWRQALEREILAAEAEGVHPVVIRPAWVYGNGGGAAMMMVAAAKEHGAALHVGDGQNRWSTVHADDLADLYAQPRPLGPCRAQHCPRGSGHRSEPCRRLPGQACHPDWKYGC
ncbi:NAD-dependent epimerase/dehydratase family protein [Labrys neptuniae]